MKKKTRPGSCLCRENLKKNESTFAKKEARAQVRQRSQ